MVVEHSLFHQSRGGELSGERMEGVVRVLSLLSKLGCMKFEVGLNWQDLGLLVEMNGVGVSGATSDCSQCAILYGLEMLEVRC